MPKERKTRSISFEARSRASPVPCSSSSSRHRGSSSLSSRNPPESPVASAKDMKEWDAVRCPVCLEHPHNAVLLICSSGDKGCHPFMCDSSYRHSNCLDQYRKAFSGSKSAEENAGNREQLKLSCPLCRGGVTGWKVVEAARRYMNSKARNCAKESCGFTGCYGELRKHARKEHPSVRPSEADPERQLDWRRMDQQRDLGDIFSTMQSAMGREDGHLGSFIEDDEELGIRSIFRISSMAVFFIFSFTSSGGVGRGRTSVRSSRAPTRVASRSRRSGRNLLWGETSELQHDDTVVSGGNIDDDINIANSNIGDDMDIVNDDDDGEERGDEEEEDGGDDYDDGGSNSGGTSEAAAVSRRRGPGRPRRLLRMSDDEMDDNNDGVL